MEAPVERFGSVLPAQPAGPPAAARAMPPQRYVSARLLPAVAATSFIAGAAVAGFAARRQARRRPVEGRRALEVVGSRSVLLDIHLLGRPRG